MAIPKSKSTIIITLFVLILILIDLTLYKYFILYMFSHNILDLVSVLEKYQLIFKDMSNILRSLLYKKSGKQYS